jgi:anti-sigma28 factor (negative regulator of flagellin synthesis)
MGIMKAILGAASPDVNKVENKKIGTGPKTNRTQTSNGADRTGDKANISGQGRELYNIRQEAFQYKSLIEHAETLSNQEIESIKEKIATNYYFDSEVIDKVVDKLLTLPNYK